MQWPGSGVMSMSGGWARERGVCRYWEFPGFLRLCGDKKPWKAPGEALPDTYGIFLGGGSPPGSNPKLDS